jgi:hypothetical protein
MEFVDPTVYPGWDERIARHPDTTVFQTAVWARVIRDTYGYQPIYFITRDQERLSTLVPFMEIRSWITGKRGVSLPFTDECALILSDGMDFGSAISQMIDFAASHGWGTGVPWSSARNGYIACCDGVPVPRAGHYGNRRGAFLPISPERQEKHPESRESRDRGGERPDATRCEGVLPVELPHPPGSWPAAAAGSFFENLRKHILEKDMGTLLLARYGGKAIAGAVFLHFGRKAIYKYGASDRRHQHLRANNLVFREGIRTLCGRGCKTLSFGRTDLAHEGLRQFKLCWGSKETRLQYFRFDVRSRSWLTRQKARFSPWEGVISKTPIPVLRLVGSIAYRHVG